MATTQKYVAGSLGTGLTWQTRFGTEVNSLTNGSYVTDSVGALTNGTSLDLMADISFVLGSITPSGNSHIAFYLLPLVHDGTNYPGGSPPPITYQVGTVGLNNTTAIQYGVLRGVILPPGSFKLGLQNNSGVTLNASGNSLAIRTFNFTFA